MIFLQLLQGFTKFDQGISEKRDGQNLCGRRKNNKNVVERDKPRTLESVRQTLPQLPWKQKRGFKKKLDSFHQTS
jgi:hypothetical protein